MPLKPEVVVDVEFLTTQEGGRHGPILASVFGCPLEFEGEFFDCRLDLTDCGPIAPGGRARIALQFLRPDLIVPRLSAGASFTLWEMRTIARGSVVEVVARAS